MFFEESIVDNSIEESTIETIEILNGTENEEE